jgi:hypothetical protein
MSAKKLFRDEAVASIKFKIVHIIISVILLIKMELEKGRAVS